MLIEQKEKKQKRVSWSGSEPVALYLCGATYLLRHGDLATGPISGKTESTVRKSTKSYASPQYIENLEGAVLWPKNRE